MLQFQSAYNTFVTKIINCNANTKCLKNLNIKSTYKVIIVNKLSIYDLNNLKNLNS